MWDAPGSLVDPVLGSLRPRGSQSESRVGLAGPLRLLTVALASDCLLGSAPGFGFRRGLSGCPCGVVTLDPPDSIREWHGVEPGDFGARSVSLGASMLGLLGGGASRGAELGGWAVDACTGVLLLLLLLLGQCV